MMRVSLHCTCKLQIVFYFQLFLSANVHHKPGSKTILQMSIIFFIIDARNSGYLKTALKIVAIVFF